MNWLEFVAEAESVMAHGLVSPENVTVRVEVSDSFYDKDITADCLSVREYNDGFRFIIWGD